MNKKKMNKEYDYIFKLVLIGDSTVGKSSLLIRFSDDTFNQNYVATIGVDFRFNTIKLGDKVIKLQIWDTAGQERFKTITSSYYKGADGIIITYDISKKDTFNNAKDFWYNQVQEFGEKDAEILLMGNKADISEREVEEAEQYANDKNCLFYEVSAKTGDNVHAGFQALADKILQNRLEQVRKRKEERRKKKAEKLGKNVNDVSIDSQLDVSMDNEENKKEEPKKLDANKSNDQQKKPGCQC